jgi:hypothetical protein
MTARRSYTLVRLLIAAVFIAATFVAAISITALPCRADLAESGALTTAEYRAELDRLLSVTQQLDSSGGSTPQPLRDLPQSWRVATDQREFDVSTEGLRRDVQRYEKENNAANAIAIRTRLQGLRSDLDGFEKPPADVSANRAALNSILARREFGDVEGPSWLDRLKQRLLGFILSFLERLIRSAAIPTIGKFFVYGLMGLALAALVFVAYRSLWSSQDFDSAIPKDLPVSAKEWAIWLAEARDAAAKGEWRDAIHLAYWAGISFLERQGMWKPDRARTPREYLRLLSSTSEHRETLTALTRTFELAWYANRGASERTFSQTLEQLEKLGCH